MNTKVEGKECNVPSNTSPNFFNKEWESISKGFHEVVGALKKPEGKVVNKNEVKKFCDSVKILSTATMIILVVAFVFTGSIGSFFCALGAILAYDAYKVAGNLQRIVKHEYEYPKCHKWTKDTLLAKSLSGFLKSYFDHKKSEIDKAESTNDEKEEFSSEKISLEKDVD